TEGVEKAFVVDLVAPEWRGRALGAYHAAVGLAALPASALFGVLYKLAGPGWAFATGAALAAAAALVLPRRPTGSEEISPQRTQRAQSPEELTIVSAFSAFSAVNSG